MECYQGECHCRECGVDLKESQQKSYLGSYKNTRCLKGRRSHVYDRSLLPPQKKNVAESRCHRISVLPQDSRSSKFDAASASRMELKRIKFRSRLHVLGGFVPYRRLRSKLRCQAFSDARPKSNINLLPSRNILDRPLSFNRSQNTWFPAIEIPHAQVSASQLTSLRPRKHTPLSKAARRFLKPMQDDWPPRAYWWTVRRTMHVDNTCIPILQSSITTFLEVLPVRIPLTDFSLQNSITPHPAMEHASKVFSSFFLFTPDIAIDIGIWS